MGGTDFLKKSFFIAAGGNENAYNKKKFYIVSQIHHGKIVQLYENKNGIY